MLPPERPDRITVAFDDHRLVANAGLILLVTLAHHLGLGELVDNYVDLGDAPGRANTSDNRFWRASALSVKHDHVTHSTVRKAAIVGIGHVVRKSLAGRDVSYFVKANIQKKGSCKITIVFWQV